MTEQTLALKLGLVETIFDDYDDKNNGDDYDDDNGDDYDNDGDNHDDNYEDLYLQCMVAREEKRLLLLLLAAVQAESITVRLMIIILIKSY